MRYREKITAAAVAALFHLLLVGALLATVLRFPPKGVDKWPPEEEGTVEMLELEDLYASGDYVRTGDLPTPVSEPSEAAPSAADNAPEPSPGPDAADAGAKADPTPPVTTEKPSPAKEKAKPKGPTKEQIEAEKKRQEAQAKQKAKKEAEAATAKAFGGKGKGTPGQADGNSPTGSFSGKPGNGLKGRTAEHWGSVRSTKTGTIAIRVRVNSQGRVTSATYDPSRSSGAAAADTQMRQRCVEASRQSRFSVLEGSPEASGTITWKFE